MHLETESAIPQKRQKYLGNVGLIIFISFLNAFIPLSTDLYLPALPQMVNSLKAPSELVNLTLVFFFIFNALGTLVFGPLSDKYGRKKILLTGTVAYTIASVCCALSGNIWQLIISRVLQAIGGGAIVAVSMALIKDVYSGKKRESILAVTQSITMVAPIVAPILGAFLLSVMSWRGVFVALTVVGLIATLGAVAFEETIDQKSTGNVLQSMEKLGVVLKNRRFTKLLLTFSLCAIPMMGFISASSYIYEDGFGLSAQLYSFYFSANAIAGILGPGLYIVLSRFCKSDKLIAASFVVTCVTGVLTCTIGKMQPLLFAACVVPSTLAGGISRPPSTSLLLDQQTGDTGAVSSLINCSFTIFGSIGIMLLSFDWINKIFALGIGYVVTGFVSLLLWVDYCKKHAADDPHKISVGQLNT